MHGTLLTVESRNDLSVEAGQLQVAYEHADLRSLSRSLGRCSGRTFCAFAIGRRTAAMKGSSLSPFGGCVS